MTLKRVVLAYLALLLAFGCTEPASGGVWPRTFAGNGIWRVHDDSMKTTCWVYGSNGISCIPDAEPLPEEEQIP